MVECDCEDWVATMPRGKGLVLYGRRIKHCPWCGEKIEYDGGWADGMYVEVLFPDWIDETERMMKGQLGW